MATAQTATQNSERNPRTMPDMAKAVGGRIRERREFVDITQDHMAKHLGISRSAIAQWESGTTTPSLSTLQDMARLLQTTPEYLAFDIKDGVRTVYRSPERESMHTVDVVAWTEGPEGAKSTGQFALDEEYAKDISLTGSADSLRAFDVKSRNLVPGVDRGDRVIVDVSADKPAQPGTYIYWNGFAASIAEMRAVMGEGGKPAVQITEAGSTSTVGMDQIKILGRVVAHWGRI